MSGPWLIGGHQPVPGDGQVVIVTGQHVPGNGAGREKKYSDANSKYSNPYSFVNKNMFKLN